MNIMTILAAFNWDKKTDSISYMFVDKKTYAVLDFCSPTRINKEDFKKEAIVLIGQFFDKVDEYDNSQEIFIEYKTYIPQYRVQHKNSEVIEKEFNWQLCRLGLDKKHVHKIRSFLTGNHLKNFKSAVNDALYDKRQKAYVVRLWEIALHVTPAKCDKIIKRLYKRRAI